MKLFCYWLLVLTTASVTASAGLLGTASVTIDASGSPAFAHETRAHITFGQTGYPFDPSLFDDTVLNESSLGLVLLATSSNDPDFDGMVATMSDGAEDGLAFRATLGNGGVGQGGTEKTWFSLATNDFAGSNINAITLTVDEIAFETDVDTTAVYLAYTVRVYENFLPAAASTWGRIKALYR